MLQLDTVFKLTVFTKSPKWLQNARKWLFTPRTVSKWQHDE